MNANFSLEDPETFNNVLPWSSVVTDSSQAEQDRAGLINAHRNTAKLLQEKVLHSYSDYTEVRLSVKSMFNIKVIIMFYI